MIMGIYINVYEYICVCVYRHIDTHMACLSKKWYKLAYKNIPNIIR